MIESVARLGERRMSKEDYRDKIEEHRQSFEEEQEEQQTLSRASRMNKNGSNNKKPKETKRKTPLMTILVVIFILIPLSILIYFWKFYEPGKTIEEAEKVSADIVEMDKSGDKANGSASTDKNKKDDKANKEAMDQAKKDAEKLAADQKAAEEAKKAEEARKAEEAKKAEQARLAQQREQAEAARKAEAEKQAATASTHTVKENENLFRIALNHYGDGSEATLAKIRAANGMSSNTVMVGQVIKLP